ncbi:MAG: hypothetical protein ABI183_12435 [Polyangiaceae bacterium]
MRASWRLALLGLTAATFGCQHAASRQLVSEQALALSSDDDGFSANCDPVVLDPHASNAFYAGDIAGTEKKPILVYSRHSGMSGSRTHMVIYEDGTATSDPQTSDQPITIARVVESPVSIARCIAQKIDGIDRYDGSPHARDVPVETIEARVGNVWRSVVFSGAGHSSNAKSSPTTDRNRIADAKSVLIETRMTDYARFTTPIKEVDLEEVDRPAPEAAKWPADLPALPQALDWSAPSWGRQAKYWIDGAHGAQLQTFIASHPQLELVAPNGTHVTLLRVSDALPDAPYLERVEKCARHAVPDAMCAVP